MTVHPSEADLALLAGGECGRISRFALNRHVRRCEECRGKISDFQQLRSELVNAEPPDLNWLQLAAEMRANIHLGLAAGECVRTPRERTHRNARLAFALASLVLLIGAHFVLENPKPAARAQAAAPVLESSGSGLELRTGAGSLTLLNHHGAVADQTVSARGELRARYIDGDTGAVTINNVYLE